MPQHVLLQTKLYIPPVRPERVSRPRLLERLNAGLAGPGSSPAASPGFSHKLTVLSAPAGFGKTTLVGEWVCDQEPGTGPASAPTQVAWLSLDEGDNNLGRFLAYLVAALQTITLSEARMPIPDGDGGSGATVGAGLQAALQSPQPPAAEAILIPLINEIAALPDRIILVLDDYHLIDSRPIHDALDYLLEHLPPQMHLVIATREDPHLALARLRARGQVTELRARDLRFSTSEAAEFLNRVMGLGLSAQDVAALESRTEGWIAGLQLAAVALQGARSAGGDRDASSFIRSFTGSHRFVLDYLVEEVLEQQPHGVQAFLLQTAILDRLSGPLCDAVCVHPDGAPDSPDGSQAILEALERANLFIVPLDQERRWYRYHQLFADLLRQRLRQTQPEQLPALHHRASQWYERHELTDEAIEHALRAQDFERAAGLIEREAEAVWVRGDDAKLRGWLDRLPAELVFTHPALCIYHAWSLFATGQQDAAEPCLQATEAALGLSTQTTLVAVPEGQEPLPGSAGQPGPEKARLRGMLATTRAFLAFYRGDVPAIGHYARQALEYLPRQDLAWRSAATSVLGDAHDFRGEMAAAYQARLDALEASQASGNSYQIIIANLKLAVVLRQQGRLQRALEVCQQQLALVNESGMSQTAIAGWLGAIWGEALAELNDLDAALDRTSQGVALAERSREVAMLGWSYICLVRVLYSRRELPAAQEVVLKLERAARDYDVPPWITSLAAAWQARIWLAGGRLEAAGQWALERGLRADGDLVYLREMEHLALARLLIAQGQVAEAAGLLRRLLTAVEPRGHTAREIEILNLQALAAQAAGDQSQAMANLGRALTLAEPGGFVRTFVDEGPPMAQLIGQPAARRHAPDYTFRLLAAFQGLAKDRDATEEPVPSSLLPHPSSLIEPLSDREIEVLRLIAQGLTNQEIASRLFLSLNTIKAHTRNIYGKLGVHSRTQAVARARDLGSLPAT